MKINVRFGTFRAFRNTRNLLMLGLATCLAIATLGVTMLPSIGAPVAEIPVGDYPTEGLYVLPTGNFITPTLAPGSTFEPLPTGLRSDGTAAANGAVATVMSPDQQTMLILTSGWNKDFNDESTGERIVYPVLDPLTGQPSDVTADQAEWVFVYDISSGKPIKRQQLNLPNTYNGIVWAPDGERFYVSAGIDDRVYVYRKSGDEFVPDAPFLLLGHNSNQTAPLPTRDGGLLKGTLAEAANTGAAVAGIDVSKDGETLVAANFYTDSISVVNTTTRAVVEEIPFFTVGGAVATGEFPFDIKIVSDVNGAAVKAYVSSQRDDEVLAVTLSSRAIARIPVDVQPNKMLLNGAQTILYVANGESDTISVINTQTNRITRTLSVARPGDVYKGSIPNSLTLSPDEKTLYVTLAGENAVAVIDVASGAVRGRIPTGWYPSSVSTSANGQTLYVVNAKDNAGPNPSARRTTEAGQARNTTFRNDYVWALEKAGLSTIPTPNRRTLRALTRQVNLNNGFDHRGELDPIAKFLQGRIKHVVYVIKENRTYDNVLGDLPIGNGDPELTLFPEPISPNHHKLALDYVTLDNFYNPGESSGVGWNWSTYGATTDYTEKHQSVLYGNANFQGFEYDYEGTNRNINIGLPQTSTNPNQINTRSTGILDPSGNSSVLPGNRDVNAPGGDGDLDPNTIGGYLWDVALRAGKSVRNYGCYVDLGYYRTSQEDRTQPDPANPLYIPISPTPFEAELPQSPPTKTALLDRTDIYFRGYDQDNADIYLFNEWRRDVEQTGLPNLSLVRLPHDHFGDFNTAVAGVRTVDAQMADNDYAVGLLVEYLSQRPEWKETLVVILEDDSQNAADHVDAHRSFVFLISPYTRRKVLVRTRYTTVDVLRTMEDILGTRYMGQNDANGKFMADVFTRQANFSPYQAIVPGVLCQAPVDADLVPACADPNAPKTMAVKSRHDADWWTNATKGFFFDVEDKLDADAFNRILWAGVKGDDIPYPVERSGFDLRQNRERLIADWRQRHHRQSAL